MFVCKCSHRLVSGWMQCWLLAACLVGSASAQTGEKSILLRNATIQTLPPARGALAAQGIGTPVSGLFLVQFERPLQPAERNSLAAEGVRLLRPVPEEAFVAQVTNGELPRIKALPFVRWIGPYKPEYKLHASVAGLHPDGFENVTVLLPPGVPPEQNARLQRLFHRVSRNTASSYGRVIQGILSVRALGELTSSDSVLWIERTPTPKLYDAVAAQIIGGEAVQVDTEIAVHELGFDGEGVTVAVADSGLDLGDPEFVHADIAGRVEAFFHYGMLEDASDEHGHGTHVTGIIAGNGALGETDEFGYLYGLGMAPRSRIVAQRIFGGLGEYHPPDSFGQMTRDAIVSGAEIGSNSWGEDTQGRYDIFAMEFDALVRDADPITAGDQPYILEFSAGNAGPGERTIGTPAVAKNVIATGASQNNRFDFFIYAEGQETMADFSSRGPAEDGRIKPDVVAPGTWIASLQSSAASDENAWLPISPNYQYQGGTSQSGPQVSGAAAVFVQYYRELNSGQTPSPALVKAALINSAVDMDNEEGGTDFIPNNDEGWGRIDLTRLIGAARRYDFVDQSELLATGQLYEHRFVVASYFEPLKITLAYTDVPGFPPAIPALVNDLDLEVISPTGILYRGNQFIDGESAFNPAASDSINNVEAVHIEFPEAGEYLLRIRARNVLEDARRDTPAIDQDFALVLSGDLPLPGQGVLAFNRRAYTVPSEIGIKLIDFDLAGQPDASISLSSTTQSTPMQVRLLPSGSVGVFTGAVATVSQPLSGALRVTHGDQITGTYQDADPDNDVVARARADLLPPLITEVSSTNRFGRELITWQTDEIANSVVFYGANGTPSLAKTNQQFTIDHELIIDGLVEGQTYQYYVMSTDEAGNVSINDNAGDYFSFVAQPASVVLLVDAYTYGFVDGRDDIEIPVTSYTDALDQTGISYEVWDVETEGSPTVDDLSPFRVVIWRINDSFWENGNTITPAQQTVIEQYLDKGGGFLLSSMEILSRLGNVPFRTNVLQVAEFVTHTDPFGGECPECHEDHGAPAIEAASLESSTSGVDLTLDYSPFPAFEFGGALPDIGPDLSDVIIHTTNAVPILVDSASGLPVGIRSPRTGMDSAGRVVFLSFPLDAVPMQGTAPNSRAGLMRALLSFLVPGVNGLGTVALDKSSYTVPSRVLVEVADSDLIGQDTVEIQFRSDTWPTPMPVQLEHTVRPGVFRGSITLVETDAGPGRLPAQHGDLIVAEYADASAAHPSRALAEVDTELPEIAEIVLEADYTAAVIDWETSELTDALVQFGESPFLSKTAYRPGPNTSHNLILSPLLPDRVYYYQVVSRDSAGNTAVDDNNGQLYTFRTLTPVLPPWSDDLEGPSDWSVFDGEGTEASWRLGTPNNELATAAHSPTRAWGTNLDGQSSSLVETYLISPAVDLQGGNQATLTFWHNYDFLYESEFKLGEGGELQVYTNSLAQPITLATYSDYTGGWEKVTIDLTPYLGHVVQFVWGYILLDFSFEFFAYPGWLIDDVSVTVENVVRGTLEVTNNIADATFTLSGPLQVDGFGRSYKNDRAPVGAYTCTFHPVPYYNTPPPQTEVLTADSPLLFYGEYTFTDANANSMPDTWEQEFFAEVSPARTMATDTDEDGASDYAEWIAGTDPMSESSKLILAEATILSNNRVQLTWPSVPGKTYRLLGSSDARTWEVYTANIQGAAPQTTFTVLQPAGVSVYFYRIEVIR